MLTQFTRDLLLLACLALLTWQFIRPLVQRRRGIPVRKVTVPDDKLNRTPYTPAENVQRSNDVLAWAAQNDLARQELEAERRLDELALRQAPPDLARRARGFLALCQLDNLAIAAKDGIRWNASANCLHLRFPRGTVAAVHDRDNHWVTIMDADRMRQGHTASFKDAQNAVTCILQMELNQTGKAGPRPTQVKLRRA